MFEAGAQWLYGEELNPVYEQVMKNDLGLIQNNM